MGREEGVNAPRPVGTGRPYVGGATLDYSRKSNEPQYLVAFGHTVVSRCCDVTFNRATGSPRSLVNENPL